MEKEIKYLGWIADGNGYRPCESRLEAIANFPRPRDVPGVRSYMGIVNTLGAFLPEFSAMKHSLTQLTKKNAKFKWGPEEDITISEWPMAF